VIHLDTSFLIDLLREARRGEDGPARSLLSSDLAGETLGVSVHVVCKLLTGVELSSRAREERARVSGILAALAEVRPGPDFPGIYARSLAFLTRSGDRISTMDLLIATAALEKAAPLVTRNRRDFERVPGLEVIGY